MNKYESDKLLDAIGGVNDRWVNELMEEPAAKASHKVKPIVKRIVIAAAAALLSISLVITVAANSDAIIAAIFERQKNLVDDKIGHIDESATVGNITLTLESVVVNNAIDDRSIFGTYTVSFHNNDGVFEGGLKYGSYKMQCIFDDSDYGTLNKFSEIDEDGRVWYTLHGDRPDKFEAFYPALSQINFGLDNPSDTITLESSSMAHGAYGTNRIIFYDLTSADGSIKYADEIGIEFKVTKEEAKPLQQLQYYEPDLPFEIENAEFTLERIDLGTTRLLMLISNPKGDSVNIGGVECCAINYFTKLANTDDFFEKVKKYSERESEFRYQFEKEQANLLLEGDYDKVVAAQKKYHEMVANDEEILRLNDEVRAANKPTEDEKILNECYEVVVEIKPECGAEITHMETSCYGWAIPATPDTVIAGFVAEFSSPIYVDDIVRVYAQKIGDPTKQVTVWVPAEDKGLDAFR